MRNTERIIDRRSRPEDFTDIEKRRGHTVDLISGHGSVRFLRRPRRNGHLSKEAGVDVYEDMDYMEISWPTGEGDKHESIMIRATPEHKAAFPRQWELSVCGSETKEGTPIKDCFTDEYTLKKLLSYGVFSLEKLIEQQKVLAKDLGPCVLTWAHRAEAYLDHERERRKTESALEHFTKEELLQLKQILSARTKQ